MRIKVLSSSVERIPSKNRSCRYSYFRHHLDLADCRSAAFVRPHSEIGFDSGQVCLRVRSATDSVARVRLCTVALESAQALIFSRPRSLRESLRPAVYLSRPDCAMVSSTGSALPRAVLWRCGGFLSRGAFRQVCGDHLPSSSCRPFWRACLVSLPWLNCPSCIWLGADAKAPTGEVAKRTVFLVHAACVLTIKFFVAGVHASIDAA
jgi:hypothetical protein